MLPAPIPVMVRPVNKSTLNNGGVVVAISINNQPMVNGILHRIIVNWRPLLSANHPAMTAPTRPPTGTKAYEMGSLNTYACSAKSIL